MEHCCGPLVNVALFPILSIVVLAARSMGLAQSAHDLYEFLWAVWGIDLGLLIFNILPVYPLDGGQILRSLLWFVLGRARSLMVAVIIGVLGCIGLIGLAVWSRDVWLGAISLYILMSCWGGFQQARILLKVAKLPRRNGFACPSCKAAPPVGELWKCGRCGQGFDTFQAHGVCTLCGAQYPVTRCGDCGASHPIGEWAVSAVAPSNL